jgi:glycosyltransferase involved in cell wall biosynthesis
MINKMTILVANNHLINSGGSETFTYTLIKELIRRKYDVEYYTLIKGEFSKKMEIELGVNFKSKKKYDLILANHNSCVTALVGCGFIIQTCHGIFPDLEQPSPCANFHVSISQEVQNHLAMKSFISVVILNGIDTTKFYPKKEINNNISNVLSLCQSNEANNFIKKNCEKLNINFNFINKNLNPVWDLVELINEADLVIGLGRSVYEAMACGRPVLIYDHREYSESFADGYITNKLASSLVNNCSGRYYKIKLTDEMIRKEILKYDKKDGEILRQFIIDNMDIKIAVDKYISLFYDLRNNNKFNKINFFFKFFQKQFYIIIIKKYYNFFKI